MNISSAGPTTTNPAPSTAPHKAPTVKPRVSIARARAPASGRKRSKSAPSERFPKAASIVAVVMTADAAPTSRAG
ncbi:hypothetical protein DW322_18740 [Rhodococcus rhodnii]|uniref:Uncharacterized protein n=1 Tax=Rhodococcus rhodnii TaxID=38312 RepID=A0A6P2CL04_9NOCA|nr:hypothetical protein DW322_18740 [Rhodococcus rhodnii]